MVSDYITINLTVKNNQYQAKMEKGCSFENNSSIYHADENGKLRIYDKQRGEWRTADSIELTNYQFNTFKAVASGVKEDGDNIVLSKQDVKTFMKEFKRGKLINMLNGFLQTGYRVDRAKLYSRYNTISTHVTNESGSEANMLFGFGTKSGAVQMSQIANGTKIGRKQLGKIRKTTDSDKYWISNENVLYRIPKRYTVRENNQSIITIAQKCGVSLYRIIRVNPEINFENPLTAGMKINIPGRYFIKSGSANSFDDVVNITCLDKHYIQDILIGIEGRNNKPELKAYYDGVGANGGALTIGFGHTGRVNGKVMSKNTIITPQMAYELLAQDILDAKADAIAYMGKNNFYSAPKSIQTGIIDIVFNKGVEPFTREGSPTANIKHDLEIKDYASAAADTILGKTTSKGLKKRNLYRAIMAISDLSENDQRIALDKIQKFYEETLELYEGTDKKLLQRAWRNAHKGRTFGFFPPRIIRALI